MIAPERITIHPTERCPVSKVWKRGKWKDHDSGASGDVGYIRADLHDAETERLIADRDRLADEVARLHRNDRSLHNRIENLLTEGANQMVRAEAAEAEIARLKDTINQLDALRTKDTEEADQEIARLTAINLRRCACP